MRLAGLGDQALPVAGRSGIAVYEDDRLGGLVRTGLEQAHLDDPDVDRGEVHQVDRSGSVHSLVPFLSALGGEEGDGGEMGGGGDHEDVEDLVVPGSRSGWGWDGRLRRPRHPL
jgi:hypothetical protein